MKKFGFKKFLLTSTTIVAIGLLSSSALALSVRTSDVADGQAGGGAGTFEDILGTSAIGAGTAGTFSNIQIRHDSTTTTLAIDEDLSSSDGDALIFIDINDAARTSISGANLTTSASAAGGIIDINAGFDANIGGTGILLSSGSITTNAANDLAINLDDSGAATTQVVLTSTAFNIAQGNIHLGEADELFVNGDGTHNVNGNILSTGNGNTITINLSNASDTFTFGGTVDGIETFTITSGNTTLGDAYTNGTDIDIAANGSLISAGAGLNLSNDIDVDGGDFVSGGNVNANEIHIFNNGIADLRDDTINADVLLEDSRLAFNAGTVFGGDVTIGGNGPNTVFNNGSDLTQTGANSSLTITNSGGGAGTFLYGFDGGAGANNELIISGNRNFNLNGITIQNYETVTFSSSVITTFNGVDFSGAEDIDVTGSGTLIIDDADDTFTVDNEIDIDNGGLDITGQTVTVTAVSGIDLNDGTLTTGGTAVLVSNLDVNTSTGSAASLSGDVVFGAGDQTATFSGDAGGSATFTNNFDGGAGAGDEIVFGNTGGTLSASGAISNFETVTVNGSGNVRLGVISDNPNTDLGANATVTFAEDVALGDLIANNSTTAFITAIDGTNDINTVTATGTVTNVGGGTITVNIADETAITTGDSYTIISNPGGGNLAGAFDLADSSRGLFLSFSEDTTTADVYAIEATVSSEDVYTQASGVDGKTTNLTNVTNAVLNPGAGANSDVTNIRTTLLTANTAAEAEAIVETVTPTLDQSFLIGGYTTNQETAQIIDARLGALRQGLSSGDQLKGMSFWTQAFGQYADQDQREGIAGYEADTFGAAFGADTDRFHENLRVGASISYGKTDVDSDNANETETDIDSYQATLYGEYNLANNVFVAGSASYTYNDINQTRRNVGGGASIATADYDSDQYGLSAAIGQDIMVDRPEFKRAFIFTPQLTADYVYVDVESYDETGAGGIGLRNVTSEALENLDVGVSFDAQWQYLADNGGFIKPSVSAGYSYAFINDEIETTAEFAGGSASFQTEGFEPGRHTVNLGIAVQYDAPNNWTFTSAYDFETKADYQAHSGLIRANYQF